MISYGKWLILHKGYRISFFLDNIHNLFCIFPSYVSPSKMGRKNYALKQLARNEKQEAQTWRCWVVGADGPEELSAPGGYWQPSRVISVPDVEAMTLQASWGKCSRWTGDSYSHHHHFYKNILWDTAYTERVGLFLTQSLWFLNSINELKCTA